MSRMKNKVPSVRVRLDGYQAMPIVDERERVFHEWYLKARGERKAFPVAKELIISALMGELGPQVAAAVSDGNTEETIDALKDLLSAFG
jgi:hypothetical protein